MRVSESIELMKRGGSRIAMPVPVDGLREMSFTCSFSEKSASLSEIAAFVPDCPPDLKEFWTAARSARLFEDQTFGQWGLEILDPQNAFDTTRVYRERRSRDCIAGDMVIGKFLGDSDLLLIRCSSATDDFGNVVVALPIDPRKDWYHVSDSLASFLNSFTK